MKKETLKKAKELENKIEYLENLLGYDINARKTMLNSFFVSYAHEYKTSVGYVNRNNDLRPLANDQRISEKCNEKLKIMAKAFGETFRAVLSEELHSLKEELEEL